jgi:hypothetical protein
MGYTNSSAYAVQLQQHPISNETPGSVWVVRGQKIALSEIGAGTKTVAETLGMQSLALHDQRDV